MYYDTKYIHHVDTDSWTIFSIGFFFFNLSKQTAPIHRAYKISVWIVENISKTSHCTVILVIMACINNALSKKLKLEDALHNLFIVSLDYNSYNKLIC